MAKPNRSLRWNTGGHWALTAALTVVVTILLLGATDLQQLRETIEQLERDPTRAPAAAFKQLLQIGPVGSEAVPLLVDALEHDQSVVREFALGILQGMGSAASDATPSLIRALASTDEDFGRDAARTLGRIGPAATPALAQALRSENEKVRERAAEGLGVRAGDAEVAIPALIAGPRKRGLPRPTNSSKWPSCSFKTKEGVGD